MPSPKSSNVAFLSAIVGALVFSLVHLGIQTSDDATMLATAGALWDNHTLAIPEMEWLNERVTIGRLGKDGQLYAKFGIGQIFAAAGFYGIGETLFPKSAPYEWAGYPIVNSIAGATLALFTNVFLAALIVGLVVYEAAELAGSEAAIFTGMMLAIASPFWLAARGFGAEIGSAFGITTAAMLARRALIPGSKVPLWLSVVGLGIAGLFRPSVLAFGLAWIVWLWRRPRRDWMTVGIAMGLVALTVPGYNWIRYGEILDSGYGDYGSGFSLQITGLIGYLFAPGRSLLFFAPWALWIAVYVFRLLRREWSWQAGVAAGVIGFYVTHSMWREWEGGWSFGPRLLVPILPIIGVLAAQYLDRFPRLSVLLFLPGSLLQAAALALDPTTTHLNAIAQEGLPFEEMAARFRETVWNPTGNIAILQLQAVATPENFVWLVLWCAMFVAWFGFVLNRKPIAD